MTCIKVEVIWPRRLQDYNVLVLKKVVEIFLATHLDWRWNSISKPTQMKNFKLQSDSKQAYNYIGERKYHSIDSMCL